MSAPSTNIERQKKRHRAPLWGMGGVLAAVALMMAAFLVWLVANGSAPEGATAQVDGRTGVIVEN